MPERNRFMKGLFAWASFRSAAVLYHREDRTVGTTKYNYWKAVDAGDRRDPPPRRPCRSGVELCRRGCGLDRAGLCDLHHRANADVRRPMPGYASLMDAILFLGGLQLLSLGVLANMSGGS